MNRARRVLTDPMERIERVGISGREQMDLDRRLLPAPNEFLELLKKGHIFGDVFKCRLTDDEIRFYRQEWPYIFSLEGMESIKVRPLCLELLPEWIVLYIDPCVRSETIARMRFKKRSVISGAAADIKSMNLPL